MNLQTVRNESERILALWSETVPELKGWTFDFNERKRALGLCWWGKKRIELSRFHALADSEAHVIDTLKHELAHALAFITHGIQIAAHGREWKEWARRVGCSPDACIAVCPGCSREFNYHREPKYMIGRFCLACGAEKGMLTVVERGAAKPTPEKKSRFF